jgi:glycosyltransferase involved in cell wall biosynthesis
VILPARRPVQAARRLPAPPEYDLCVAVNYYTPYVSGLTEVAKVVAEGLAARGRRVAVVACRHDAQLPQAERINGVDVYRAPVVATIGRGLVSPGFPAKVRQIATRSRVLHTHLPMLEAAPVAALSPVPVVSTYHIDLWLPPGLINRAAMAVTRRSATLALRRSTAVVVNSEDQAVHSELWPVLRATRRIAIAAPCADRRGGSPRYRETGSTHYGFLGRVVPDKGLTYLLAAFARIDDPDARLLIGGDYTTVAGGSVIAEVRAAADRDSRIRVLGLLGGREIHDFYASSDVFALPSVAESFGIAQAEAMMCGIPSVTTDLPGGRYPVQATGHGLIVPPRDPVALHRALREVAGWGPRRRAAGAARARELFGTEGCLDRYAALFDEVSAATGHHSPERPTPDNTVKEDAT